MKKLPVMSQTDNLRSIDLLFSNPVLLSAVFSWGLAQFIKVVINLVRGRPEGAGSTFVQFLWKTGGMPSSHSSAIVAVTTAVGFTEGLNSSLFAVMLVMTVIVIRDALGVRHSSGVQARALNLLGSQLKKKKIAEFKLVKEVNGHTFPEVAVGIILGFFIAVAFCNL